MREYIIMTYAQTAISYICGLHHAVVADNSSSINSESNHVNDEWSIAFISKSHGQQKSQGLPTPCFWLSWMPTNRVQTLLPRETYMIEAVNI